MAQFLTILSVLLLFAVFNSIVCPGNKMFSERRDRAPYIESGDHSPQYLSGMVGSVGGRLKKGSAHSKEETVSQAHNPSSNNEQETGDNIVDQNIRNIFSTNFGPGLYLFKNTAQFLNQPHFNSYNDQMLNDQPVQHTPPSSPSTNDMDFFKVQRSPDGNLSLVYKDDYVPKLEKNKTNLAADNQYIGSNKENRFQTHFSDGLPLKKDKVTSLPTAEHSRTKDSAIHFPTEEPDIEARKSNGLDISDCLEDDQTKSDKVFCSHLRNYPEKNHLENLIKKKFPNLESFFGEDLVLPQNISQRMNNAPNEEYLCRSRVRVIFPQSGLNKDYNWLYIVNSSNYKQGIRIEECLDPGATCGENTGLSLPNRFTATCEQNYIYRSLIAYTNETVVKDTFRVPSCCKCVLRSY